MSRTPPPRAPTHEDPLATVASEALGGPLGRHARPHPWWSPVRVVLAVTCLAWLLAAVQKAPCAQDDWGGENSRYGQMCYSDIPYLYVSRGFAERVVPFTDTGGRYPDLEYPVLIGYVAWVGAVATQALNGWPDAGERSDAPVEAVGGLPGVEEERQDSFPVTALLLAPFVLLAAFFLAGAHRGRPWDAMAFAAAPTLVLTGLVNWDVLAVAAVAGAFWAWSRGSPVLAGVMVGLGTAAKLYPLFLLGAFLVVVLRRRMHREGAEVFLAAGLTWLACNLPAMIGDFEAWAKLWRFNASRGPDLGSLWLVASYAGHPASPETVNRVSWLLFGALCLAVLVLGLRSRHVPRVAQLALLILIGFLLVNKVYSPQYVLWLLPVAVLARPRWRDLLIWQAGEIYYFVMVWLFLGQYTASGTTGETDGAYSWAIVVRVAAELYLAAVVVRDVLRPWKDPAREHLDADPMTPRLRR